VYLREIIQVNEGGCSTESQNYKQKASKSSELRCVHTWHHDNYESGGTGDSDESQEQISCVKNRLAGEWVEDRRVATSHD
jgi:hypothetical protein